MRSYYYVSKDLRPGRGWCVGREMKHLHTLPTREAAEAFAAELAQSEWEQYGRPTAVRTQTMHGWRQTARFGGWASVPPVLDAVA
ncbi:hypothetical protein [Rehaibacterium terrae]|jgi:hypothetical protein|uniref:Uncharacterized protein n=1 Tax=Rehaibacterium terrae TaxID=1341696 RepID=A0A7W7V906_9GAMM|nr:hypothetical protein [Rehaibacterium terrae]MBB5014614.1 hypothetical protein [Rehaibacterium terrae]